MNCRYGSSGRAPALQAQSPEFLKKEKEIVITLQLVSSSGGRDCSVLTDMSKGNSKLILRF
jgi:hypothetical protein